MPEGLTDLHGRLHAALGEGGYPVDPPGRHFTPHVTLVRKLDPNEGRIKQFAPMPELAVALPPLRPGAFGLDAGRPELSDDRSFSTGQPV